MGTKTLAAVLTLACASAIADGGEAAPKFTRKPTATREGGKVRIEFAVDRETDVAVFIENAKGEIVRHLVAGALGGANPPPAPLKPGLSQSVEWDGKADYGKPAEGGPFKVRVALGLAARYKDVVARDPASLSLVMGMTAGPDGCLYVASDTGNAVFKGRTLQVFSREGKYLRTIMPFGPELKLDEAKGFGAVEIGGRPTLLARSESRLQIYPRALSGRLGMCVSRDNQKLRVLFADRKAFCLLTMTSRGAAVGEDPYCDLKLKGCAAPSKLLRKRGRGQLSLVNSSDGHHMYLAGLKTEKDKNKEGVPAVYRLSASAPDGQTEVFFGQPGKAGSDSELLGGAPGGLAADGKGRVFISDTLNNRVLVVGEKDGKVKSEIKCPRPHMVTASAKSGAVFVLSLPGKSGAEVLKFQSPKGGQAVARLPVRGFGESTRWSMALDAAASPAILWLASGEGGGGRPRSNLLRIEDGGAKLEGRNIANYEIGVAAFLDVTVDRLRKEVYSRVVGGRSSATYIRFNEESGRLDKLQCPGGTFAGKGLSLLPHPNGNLYSLRWPCTMKQFDRGGKPLAWKNPKHVPREKKCQGTSYPVTFKAHDTFVPVSMLNLPHTLGIRWSDGRLCVLEPGHVGGRVPKMLHEYLTTGERATKDPIVWKVSDSAVGPRYDPQGNIYIAEVVRPKGWVIPPEIEKHVGKFEPGKKLPETSPKNMAERRDRLLQLLSEVNDAHQGDRSRVGGAGVQPPLDWIVQLRERHVRRRRVRPLLDTGHRPAPRAGDRYRRQRDDPLRRLRQRRQHRREVRLRLAGGRGRD
ncbi:MAG: NHL repeat-containing protein [Planctomycetota bacterium]